jgi:HK97 family phage portal protein
LLLDALFKKAPPGLSELALLSGQAPFYSQYGHNIYASDIVQTCVDCIATEMSKLQPKHIRRDPSTGKLLKPSRVDINQLLMRKPNPLMTTRDFIEKVIWTLYLNSNVFIYPSYELVIDSRGNKSRNYTGLWPLSPLTLEWLQDASGALFVKFVFPRGVQTILPYEDVIHIRKKFSINDVMGGGLTGTADNMSLQKVININDTILSGTANGIKLSQGIRGVLELNTTLDDAKKEAERRAFMAAVESGAGVVPMDFKGKFTPVDLKSQTIDAETLKFIENKILRWFGVSLPILDGTYNDSQYAAFYNKTLETIVTAFNQAFTNILFSPFEQSHGNEIAFFQSALELTDVANKLAIMDTLGNRGALSNNQARALFGLEPIEGGDEYYTSLNYINVNIVDQYQLARAKIGANPVATQGGKQPSEE